MGEELSGNTLLIVRYLYLNNQEVSYFFKLYYDVKSKYNNVTPTNIIRGSAGTNPVNLALGSIYKEFSSSQFIWYILSILFLPPEYTLKLLLASFQVSPYTPLSFPSFQLFCTKIHCPVSIDTALASVFGINKLYIYFEDIVTLYTKMPIVFQQYVSLQNEIRCMVGAEICRRIEFRNSNIRIIQDYYTKNNKYPNERCCDVFKRYIFNLPPLYQYDYSYPQDKVDSTFEQVIRYTCSLYYPKISVIHRIVRNSLNTSFGRPSIKEKASDASKPKCNRSVRSSLRNVSTCVIEIDRL